MKTILGFDSWTEGSPHFERLVPELEKRGYRLILVHIGSWGHDLNRPVEEKIGRLEVRDISYYGRMSFRQILEKEQPAAVLFFSTRALAHQAFNNYCQYLGIPTLHVYHGLVTVQAVDPGTDRPYKLNWIKLLNLVRTRLGKNLTKIWPVYWKSLLDTGAPLSVWLDFVREISAKLQLKNIPAPRAATTTAGCVYAEADVSHMARTYGIPERCIHTVGNPDLLGFGLQEKDLGSWLSFDREKSAEIIYIDTALIEAGVVFANQDAFISHLADTHAALDRQGLHLVVKLHPAHYRTGLPERLKELGIALCGKEEFVHRLQGAQAALVEPSSAAVIPSLLGMPLLLAQYGKLAGQRYGTVLTSYPMSAFVHDLADVGGLLEELRRRMSREDIADWIKTNSGPLPAEDMPTRVVEVIQNLCHEPGSERPRA
ncbi:hypothetical protein FGKAn22_23450 [Ferrigenium kumadai]|uniref:Uncharacterized protein n=1 Tax=Ferrigenium kumadai TaxID=1682490 RepID=A0AAN1W1A4_9PROT|nr:hypothetical protein [Ferrigenium kumadai]BBJ00653.1 hypothetical protein FGKAn22_23450 [Ferrigenium kumadai]